MPVTAERTDPSAALAAASPTSPNGEAVRPTTAVVPVAGHGTRLRPLSAFIPKELLPVGSRLALWRIAEELYAGGIKHIIFVVSPEKRSFVEKCFGHSSDSSDTLSASPFSLGEDAQLRFDYVLQESMRGLGDAVLQAKSLVGNQPFVVALGDAVYEEPVLGGLTRRLIDAFVADHAEVALAVQAVPAERIQRYGIVRPVSSLSISDATVADIPAGMEIAALATPPSLAGVAEIAGVGKESKQDVIAISDIVEKPSPAEAPSNLAAAARYVVSPEVFTLLERTAPDAKGEVQFTHALQALLRAGKKGVAVPLRFNEVRHDIGSLDSYYRAFVAFALNDPEQGQQFRAFLRQRLQESDLPSVENE